MSRGYSGVRCIGVSDIRDSSPPTPTSGRDGVSGSRVRDTQKGPRPETIPDPWVTSRFSPSL